MIGLERLVPAGAGWARVSAYLLLFASAETAHAADTAAPTAKPIAPSLGPGKDTVEIGTKSCATQDYGTAALRTADGRMVLHVTGMAQHPGMTIEVRPVLYVMQPDFWQMGLVACDPAGSKPTGPATPFDADIGISGWSGRKGIDLNGHKLPNP